MSKKNKKKNNQYKNPPRPNVQSVNQPKQNVAQQNSVQQNSSAQNFNQNVSNQNSAQQNFIQNQTVQNTNNMVSNQNEIVKNTNAEILKQNESVKKEIVQKETVQNSSAPVQQKADENPSKKAGKDFGVFISILLGLFILATACVILSKKAWGNGLENQIRSTFEEHNISYEIKENVPVSSGFAINAAIFELEENSSKGTKYAVIIKITSIYGSLPAVYVYDLAINKAEFVDYCLVDGLFKQKIIDNTQVNQIESMASRIPSLVKNSLDTQMKGAAK